MDSFRDEIERGLTGLPPDTDGYLVANTGTLVWMRGLPGDFVTARPCFIQGSSQGAWRFAQGGAPSEDSWTEWMTPEQAVLEGWFVQ